MPHRTRRNSLEDEQWYDWAERKLKIMIATLGCMCAPLTAEAVRKH